MNELATALTKFTDIFEQSVLSGTFIKASLSNKKDHSSDLNNIFVKPVMIREQLMISFVFRHKTKDITKNFDLISAKMEISHLLTNNFNQGFLATTTNDYQLLIGKKDSAKLLKKEASSASAPSFSHDKVKPRIIGTGTYLMALGILNKEGKVKPDMQDKYRQINKYVEIVDSIIKDIPLPELVKVADMGAGKGYLTFAMYDYLTSKLQKQVEMTGVELRHELVDTCNTIAKESHFEGLKFVQGAIEKSDIPQTDILIALHACDTATDEAIFKGIKMGAEVIVCSPCCHKQVRRDLETSGVLSEITQFGILAERQAEILTDTIRALMLEAYGYRTNVAEFVATEHTPKNLIISAVKKKLNPKHQIFPDPEVIKSIEELKKLFNLRSHYLQELFH